MRRIGIVCFCIGILGSAFAQQQAQYSQFMVNPYLVNPALSGAEDFLDIKFGYRQQWVGLGEGNSAPTTMYFSAHMPIGKANVAQTHKGDYHNWHGIGVLAYKDQQGIYNATNGNSNKWSNTYAALNYAYNLKLTDGSGFNAHHKDGMRLAMGAFLGMNKGALNTDFTYPIDIDPTQSGVDPSAFGGSNVSTMDFDLSIGGLLYFREAFTFGLSTFQSLGGTFDFVNNNSRFKRHYYAHLAYKFEMQDHIYIWPSLLWKQVGNIISYDLNARLDYHDQIFGGISFRMGNGVEFRNSAVTLMAGGLIELIEHNHDFRKGKHRYGIEIFYSYDISTNFYTPAGYDAYDKGSHEIILGFRLPPMLMERNAEDTW